MPSERYLEILVSRSVSIVFGEGFHLLAQQLTLPSGRVDLLLEDDVGCKHIVELKKDCAKVEAVDQVYRYLEDFRSLFSTQAVGWVCANEISPSAKARADHLGVRTISIPEKDYRRIMLAANLTTPALFGVRVVDGVLKGGGVQKFNKNGAVLGDAVALLPETAQRILITLGQSTNVAFEAGKLQVVVIFRGIKIGGVNRLHCYISSNVVLDENDASVLREHGFDRITKTQSGSSHTHVYWKSKLSNLNGVKKAFEHFFTMIELRLLTY